MIMKWLISLSITFVLATSTSLLGQRSVEVYGSVGYTGVDAEEWAGTTLNDWDQFASGWYLQVFPYSNDIISLGIEYGYSYLLFYTFNDSFFNISRDVDATRLMAMARLFPDRNLIIEGGLGLYFFDGFSNVALGAGVGYRVDLPNNFSIPIKFRTNFIFDQDASIIQPGLDAGVSYSF